VHGTASLNGNQTADTWQRAVISDQRQFIAVNGSFIQMIGMGTACTNRPPIGAKDVPKEFFLKKHIKK